MKTLLIATVLILLVLPSFASDLPPCPEGTYHNCFGAKTFTNGTKYIGEWKDTKRSGKGTFTWAHGDRYEGEFKDGNRTGNGTYTWADGDKYVGEFKDGKSHGKGTFTWADGEKYVGEFKNGDKHGKGTYTFASGKVKSGIWADDEYLYDLAEHRRREENNARTECAKEAGKAGTEYAAKKIEEACLEQKGYGKAWYEW